MTALRQRMLEDMQLRGFSARTQDCYVAAVHQLAEHYHRSPDRLTEEDLRQYFLYLVNDKKVARATATIALCGIRFSSTDRTAQSATVADRGIPADARPGSPKPGADPRLGTSLGLELNALMVCQNPVRQPPPDQSPHRLALRSCGFLADGLTHGQAECFPQGHGGQHAGPHGAFGERLLLGGHRLEPLSPSGLSGCPPVP